MYSKVLLLRLPIFCLKQLISLYLFLAINTTYFLSQTTYFIVFVSRYYDYLFSVTNILFHCIRFSLLRLPIFCHKQLISLYSFLAIKTTYFLSQTSYFIVFVSRY